MPPMIETVAKYSKDVEVYDDPIHFDDILQKQEEFSRNSHDGRSLRFAICNSPRSEHQKLVQKHRLCKPFLVLVVILSLSNRKSRFSRQYETPLLQATIGLGGATHASMFNREFR